MTHDEIINFSISLNIDLQNNGILIEVMFEVVKFIIYYSEHWTIRKPNFHINCKYLCSENIIFTVEQEDRQNSISIHIMY